LTILNFRITCSQQNESTLMKKIWTSLFFVIISLGIIIPCVIPPKNSNVPAANLSVTDTSSEPICPDGTYENPEPCLFINRPVVPFKETTFPLNQRGR